MATIHQARYCTRCCSRLARDNTGGLCGACSRAARDALDTPPPLPAEFWHTDQMREALDTWHMGRVIFAYRTHPYHSKPVTQEMVGNWLGLTQAQLSRIENGKPPEELSKLIRYAIILAIPADLLWFKLPRQREAPSAPDASASMRYPPSDGRRQEGASLSAGTTAYHENDSAERLTARSESVDRRNFLAATAGAAAYAAAPAFDLLSSVSHAPIPDEVRQSDIQQVRSAARVFTSWDHTYGGGIVREAVTAQLRWSAELLEVRCPDRLRSELFAAVGYLSGVCGFMAFDAYAHDDARRMFAFGLSCAEESGDWHLRAKLLSHMARQAIWCGDPDRGLTNTELALVRADRLTGTERAMLHTARARALGKLGRTQETLTAVGRADDAFASSNPHEDPPWMTYYDHPQHHGDTGHALFDLAIHAVPGTEAAPRLAEAVRGHTDAYARSRAISGTKLATLLMATGDPLEATATGQRAIDDAGRLRSRRAADDLRELRRLASAHAASPDVADLRERITKLVGVP
jgi:transcriptional regulator with XRE-family HTH domain